MAIPRSASPHFQRGGGATPEQTVQALKKLGGFFWWFLLGFMVMCDLIGILGSAIVSLGMAAAAAGTVATFGLASALVLPVGFSVAAVGWLLGVFFTFNAFILSTGFYRVNNVPILEARKLATIGLSVIIEAVPYANILPMITISFVLITLMENAKRGGGIIGAVAQKTIARAGPVGAVAGKVLLRA